MNSPQKKTTLNGEFRNNMNPPTIKEIIFIGNPEFGAIILEGMVNYGLKPILAITSQDRPAGRGKELTSPPVKMMAEKCGVPAAQPKRIQDIIPKLKSINPDLIIVAAFGQIFPKELLEIPKYKCFNVHPSLLPKYRGPSPIQSAILNGDEKTGITIMLVDEKMDHGPIVAQRVVAIEDQETYLSLHQKLAEMGTRLLMETIPNWIDNLIEPVPQDDSKASFTKAISKEDGKINWQKTAQEIEKEVRAYYPWPGSFTYWSRMGKSIQLKITKARVVKAEKGILSNLVGKTTALSPKEFLVQCGQGVLREKAGEDMLAVERLQEEGKKEMNSHEFLLGHPEFVGTILK